MKIETFKHTGVKPDGTFTRNRKGAVETELMFRMSMADGGCDLPHCNCSNGHWIMIGLPRTCMGVVEGVSISFDNNEQMHEFLRIMHSQISMRL